MKKVLKVLLLVVLALTTVFCAGCNKTEKVPENPTEIIANVKKNMEEIKECEAKVSMELDFNVGKDKLTLSSTLNITKKEEPLELRAEMTVVGTGVKEEKTSLKLIEKEDTYTVSTKYNDEWNNTQTDKETFDNLVDNYISQLDCSPYLRSEDAFKIVEETEDDGFISLEGYVKTDDMKEAFQDAAALTQVYNLLDNFQSVLDRVGDIPVKLLLKEDSQTIKRIQVDISNIIDSLYKNNDKKDNVKVQKASIIIEFADK